MKALLFAGTVAVSALCGSSALAWHNQGHQMTAAIAWKTMHAPARCRAAQLLQTAKIYSQPITGAGAPAADEALFVSAATWPDRIKEMKPPYNDDGEVPKGAKASQNIGSADMWLHKYWHYVDYPVPDDPTKPPPSVNAEERIELFTSKLAAADTSDDLKAYDLAWLIHLVGDVHQPLHAATQYSQAFVTPKHPLAKDDGGNGVPLKWADTQKAPNPHKVPYNLHAYWDAAPGDGSDIIAAIAAADALPPPAEDQAKIADPKLWVTESHLLADTKVYVAPVVRGSAQPVLLDDTYLQAAAGITQVRIALGGVRLGRLLDATLTGPSPGCPAPS